MKTFAKGVGKKIWVGVTEIGTAGDAFELIAFYLWLCLKAKKTEN